MLKFSIILSQLYLVGSTGPLCMMHGSHTQSLPIFTLQYRIRKKEQEELYYVDFYTIIYVWVAEVCDLVIPFYV